MFFLVDTIKAIATSVWSVLSYSLPSPCMHACVAKAEVGGSYFMPIANVATVAI